MRWLALLWLGVVVLAAGHLGWRLSQGLVFRTDLMALLPREEHDPALQRANDAVTEALSRRMVLMVGGTDRAAVRAAAVELGRRIGGSGVAEVDAPGFGKDRLRQIGALYFRHRAGLLGEAERRLLQVGDVDALGQRAMAQLFGVLGAGDAAMVRRDPFMLMPGFLAGLPMPLSRLGDDDGMLSVREDGRYWVMVAARLTGAPFALETQGRLVRALDLDGFAAARPDEEVLRLGAVFFAAAGARQAMDETAVLGLVSLAGTVLLVLFAYRAVSPLLLSLLVIGVGVGCALSACLVLFGDLHIAALLFGVSLIGVAVDYSLQYCTEIFAAPAPPRQRLRRVAVGIGLGGATTVIGYLTLFFAPFPGLQQIAAFSAIGLVAAWATVMLWLPGLDGSRVPRHGAGMVRGAGRLIGAWQGRRVRVGVLGVLLVLGAAGAVRVHADDDVRRMQSLEPGLVAQQGRVQSLIGSTAGNQFLLVQAADDEAALRIEEGLIGTLQGLVKGGALAGFQAVAQFVPSMARQAENRALYETVLAPRLEDQARAMGLLDAPEAVGQGAGVLTLDAALTGPALRFLDLLRLAPGLHVVSLEGVSDPAAVSHAVAGMAGVRFVDPVGQFSALLAKYRVRALALLGVSAALMAPLLVWRYGVRSGRVIVPPVLAVVLAPCLRALAGGAFSFFDAMGLVLILSVGMDYAVFCAEARGARQGVTMLAVILAAAAALLSFGVLAFSQVHAVQAFGATMAVGIALALLLSPLAMERP